MHLKHLLKYVHVLWHNLLPVLLVVSRNVLVMGHKNSDLDSFGASLAAARIAENLGKRANIVIDYESLEEKTKGVVEMLRSNPDYKV